MVVPPPCIESFQPRLCPKHQISSDRALTATTMGEKKVTIMILKVDLQCEKCYRKVKKVLCKFPQIRDQTYDEKNNLVIIKVVCCSPEKIRDKLCCKGGDAIKSIDIKESEKLKDVSKEKQKEDKLKDDEKLKDDKSTGTKDVSKEKKKEDKLKDDEKLKDESKTKNPCCMDCYGGRPGGPCETRPPRRPVYPCCMDCYGGRPGGPCETRPPRRPVYPCCMDCYEGRPGGPCETGYGYGGPAPYIQYDGYYGRPVYDSYGGGRSYTTSYCVTRPDCFSEENPQACAIM
ncbi:protein PYRICULARIA ORYZAE RESISTANCE 21-like [Rosa rugosa]|uniref:protein PYRICULARIA ORYZAE RESISTANCE 21-like n=1 Tax=Rosa rugosa TaxID=74645 RepID=UPI002B406B2F|nr:protein PYRICULARIA ORYZAE RESISTANCE 21-like [Rosa rugosa]